MRSKPPGRYTCEEGHEGRAQSVPASGECAAVSADEGTLYFLDQPQNLAVSRLPLAETRGSVATTIPAAETFLGFGRSLRKRHRFNNGRMRHWTRSGEAPFRASFPQAKQAQGGAGQAIATVSQWESPPFAPPDDLGDSPVPKFSLPAIGCRGPAPGVSLWCPWF